MGSLKGEYKYASKSWVGMLFMYGLHGKGKAL